MSGAEVRFRVANSARTALERARVALAPPRWPRNDSTAHRAFAERVSSRSTAFPLACPDLQRRVALIHSLFPSAAQDAADRADRILEGHYDLLGYRNVPVGQPPAWHADPVHGRRAPLAFWADVPFLDPATGDHKIIWELNRHQHWLALGRAYQLTGDRRYYREFVSQLESWLAANPPLQGPNWVSMLELAFRALSWLWALHLFAPAAASDPPGAPPWSMDLLRALDRQLGHVERNLSRYFSPNTHLTGEALALYVCGLALPELPDGARRARLGRAVLLEEAGRQVRGDGGHAELSAHYHHYSTDFYLLACAVARIARDGSVPAFERAARRQAEFLRAIADDEGRLPLLGDDDGGSLFPMCGREPADCSGTLATAAVLLDMPDLSVAGATEESLWLCGDAATRLRVPGHRPWPSRALTDSGYLVSRTPEGDHLVLDAGPHGYMNGGHAHADALSVVLTVQGQPLLVDGGTATYTMDAAVRDQFRSSAMHNTVVVGGRSQSEPDGPFHWRSATDAHASIWQFGRRADYLEGRHAAYAPATHVRQVLAVPGLGWFFVDHLLGAGESRANAFWHLHPDWRLEESSTGGWTARSGARVVALAASEPLVLSADLSLHSPVYGRIVEAPCLSATLPAPIPSSLLTFVATAPDLVGGLHIQSAPVALRAGEEWHTAAFEVRGSNRSLVLLTAVERDGVPARSDAGPGAFWGIPEMRTDARIALTFPGPGGNPASVLVNGTAIRTSAAGTGLDRASGNDSNNRGAQTIDICAGLPGLPR